MNKEDFFDRLEEAKEHFEKRGYSPKGLRVDKNSCPFNPRWGIWITGPGSLNPTLVSASDIMFVSKYNSSAKANTELAKYQRWFKEWENDSAS